MKSVNKTKTLMFALLLFGMLALTPAAKASIVVDVARDTPNAASFDVASGATFSVTLRIENNNTGGDTGRTNSGNYTLNYSGLTLVSGPTPSGSYTNLAKLTDNTNKTPSVRLTWTFQAPTGPATGSIALSANITSVNPSRSFPTGGDKTGGDPQNTNVGYAVTVLAPADTTPPVVNVSFPSPDGLNGWFVTSPVVGSVTATDLSNVTAINVTGAALSGVSGLGTTSASGTLTVSAEGENAVNATATDGVLPTGNTGAASGSTNTATVKIDTVAPVTTKGLTGTSGTGGWYISDVGVTLTAADSGGSGVAAIYYILNGGDTQTYSGPFLISVEGVNALVHWAVDNAGNSETPVSQEIWIDKTAPTLDVTLDGTLGNNGWYRSAVEVAISADDEYSGIAMVEYSLDEGAPVTSGGPFPITFTITVDGIHTLDCVAIDIAGYEYPVSLDIYIDQTDPDITAWRTPPANADGWNKTDVTAEYSASDATSGLDSPASGSHVFGSEGAGQSYTFTVYDLAGNSDSATVSGVNIDKTSPATVKTLGGLIGNDDWYVTDVSVTLNATDGLSGVKEVHYVLDGGATQTYSGPFTIATNGVHTLEHWAVDYADNEEEHATQGIKVDKTPPMVTATLPDTGRGVGVYVLGEVVDATWSAEDPVPGSGLATDPAEGNIALDTSSIGAQSVTIPAGTAEDNAGNESQAVIVTYYVEYGFKGLLSPYQEPPKSYKINSSIPLKWQYTDDSGNPVDSPNADPFPFIWLGSRSTMPDPDGDLPIVLNDPGSSGLRYDSLTKTWQYNWQTKGLAPGTYAIFIYSFLTDQADGPFPIQLKK